MKSVASSSKPALLAVLDQESALSAKEIWPTVWPWSEPRKHLKDVEDHARALVSQGRVVHLVFVDPVEYVEWCRRGRHTVDSAESLAMYSQALAANGGAVAYQPNVPLWSIGFVAIAYRSEVGQRAVGRHSVPVQEQIIRPLVHWCSNNVGLWVVVAIAARQDGCGEVELWQHVGDSLIKPIGLDEVDVHICAAVLGARYAVNNAGMGPMTSAFGPYDTVEATMLLAEAGAGLFGIEHVGPTGQGSFRAWRMGSSGVATVPAIELARRLGEVRNLELASGWPLAA